MIVKSDNSNIIYIDNAKCGSTSIKQFLKEECLDYKEIYKKTNKLIKNKNKNNEFHFDYLKLNADEMKLLINNFYDYFRFIIIRNPFDLLVSWYFDFAHDKNFYHKINIHYDITTRFYYSFEEYFWHYIENNIFNNCLLKSKIIDSNKNMIVNKIYKLEDFNIDIFENDINEFNLKNGNNNIIKFKNRHLDIINKSEHKHYSHYYNYKMIKTMKEIFNFELEIGNYDYNYICNIPHFISNKNILIIITINNNIYLKPLEILLSSLNKNNYDILIINNNNLKININNNNNCIINDLNNYQHYNDYKIILHLQPDTYLINDIEILLNLDYDDKTFYFYNLNYIYVNNTYTKLLIDNYYNYITNENISITTYLNMLNIIIDYNLLKLYFNDVYINNLNLVIIDFQLLKYTNKEIGLKKLNNDYINNMKLNYQFVFNEETFFTKIDN